MLISITSASHETTAQHHFKTIFPHCNLSTWNKDIITVTRPEFELLLPPHNVIWWQQEGNEMTQ